MAVASLPERLLAPERNRAQWALLAGLLALNAAITLALAATPLNGRDWYAASTLTAVITFGAWITATEIHDHLILNITTAGLALTLAALTITAWANHATNTPAVLGALLAALVVGVVYVVLVLAGASSPGDFKLATALAIPAAMLSLNTLLIAAALPYLIALPQSLHRMRTSGRKSGIAFGPYLIAGTALTLALALADIL